MSDLAELAAEAYVYGFPMVVDLDEVGRFTRDGMGSVEPAPFNRFSHAAVLAGPKDTFVSINNDTVYSVAQLDLSGGPLLLRVPDTGGRYYVLQFVDAWTDNFAYVGRRATGTAAGGFLLVPPGWTGDAPQGVKTITAPTTVATIVGRWACDGVDDLPAVRALQQATTLEPLGAGAPCVGLPAPESAVAETELVFFEKLRTWMRAFPPAPADQDYQQKFAPLGLLDRSSPYVTPSAELEEALRTGYRRGKDRVEHATTHGAGPEQNGWKLTYDVFNYNLDFFEVGTVKSPQWVLQDRGAARTVRAAAARAGLWGNHGYEAAYAMAWDDEDGKPLDGTQAYTIRFETTPPVDAFWSITMYDMPRYYLVDNPIGRYSIGDRTADLHYDRDDSLTLHLQPERPADRAAAANWLPTPPGPFRPILRMYQPHPAVFDGRYTIPPITRREHPA
ncbi:DUF1254 domain-containing protein [Streptomyces sp. NBC_01428]|uniref:DUF1254 domain-containing protein n=1 Tax=Streptomyces sp. NBC_01428 TaxID=2903861 RepID=UPI002E33765C|nr:DUF1254 domain-containing protein [Streptomyces sp. NBC_01428]